ncbi:hypothetical protein X975_17988, partial [Stegodyphus mimosarum]
MPITRGMEEQLRQLVTAFAAFQEKMEAGQASFKKEIKAGQESAKEEMKAVQEKVEADQESIKEEMKAVQERLKLVKVDTVENKVGHTEERVSSVKQQIEERVSSVKEHTEERVSVMEQQTNDRVTGVAKEVDTLKKFVAMAGGNTHDFKFLTMPARPFLKLPTYDGKTSRQMHDTIFYSDGNKWMESPSKGLSSCCFSESTHSGYPSDSS